MLFYFSRREGSEGKEKFMTSEYLWLAAQNLLSPGIGILMEGEGESGAAAQTNSVGNFFTALGKIVTEFRTGFGNIFLPVAIVCVAICAFKILIASNQNEVGSAKKWLIGILVAVVLFYFAPVLINTIAEAAKTAAAGS